MAGITFTELLAIVARLAAAFALALLLGLERTQAASKAGVRTFPLVALGACAYLSLAKELFPGTPEAEARVVQGILTGIGFVGAGAIIKARGHIRGLATAAGLWNAGAIGFACAYGMLVLGLILALANLATLHAFSRGALPRSKRRA